MGGKKAIRWLILPWIIWFVSAIFFCHQIFLRVSITGMAPILIYNIHVNAATLASIAACFYYAYMVWMLAGGVLLDLYGPRRLLLCAVSVLSIGCFIFAISNSPIQMEIGRFLMGSGGAFSMISTLYLVRHWFSESDFPFLRGLTTTIGLLGAVLGAGPLNQLLTNHGWRKIMLVATVVSVGILVLQFFIIKDSPDKTYHPIRKIDFSKLIHAFKTVLSNGQIWFAGLYAMCLYTVVTVFASLWCDLFLESVYPHYKATDFYGASLVFLGFAIGASVIGFLVRACSRVRIFIAGGALISIILFVFVLYVSMSITVMFTLLFLLGLCSASGTLGMVVARGITTSDVSGTAFGVIGFFPILGGSIGVPLVGHLLDVDMGNNLMLNQIQYPIVSFKHALNVELIFIVASFVAACFIRKLPLEKK